MPVRPSKGEKGIAELWANIKRLAEREEDEAPLPPPRTLPGQTWGARTRAGTPCKRKDLYGNGRCRLHGGLSTGPRTEEGKRRSAANGKCPKRKRRIDRGKPSP